MPPCDIDTRDIDTRFYDKNIFILFGAIVSAVICCLYGGFATHAGALWRDEVNSLEMATMPTLSDVWSAMNYDSFPILLTLVLRLWIAITGVATEASLRAFGFLVAIAVLAALWCSSRLLGSRAPWLSLVLFAGSPLVIRTIECIRPYGLGVAFILTTLGLVWMVATRRGGWPMFVVASMAATLSVQCLYSNAVLLLAICLGGLVVALDRRDWRCGPLVLGVGLISAISLLPYQGHLRTAATWLAPVRPNLHTAGFQAVCGRDEVIIPTVSACVVASVAGVTRCRVQTSDRGPTAGGLRRAKVASLVLDYVVGRIRHPDARVPQKRRPSTESLALRPLDGPRGGALGSGLRSSDRIGPVGMGVPACRGGAPHLRHHANLAQTCPYGRRTSTWSPKNSSNMSGRATGSLSTPGPSG